MPNQRKQSKAHIGGYFEKSLVARLERLAAAEGIDRTELLTRILTEAVAAYERNPKILRYPAVRDEGLLAADAPPSSSKDSAHKLAQDFGKKLRRGFPKGQ